MRRPGVTLLEVLAAIFITGIGLLSLLTLFPLGALKMAEAIKDDRAAQAGGNGIAIANATSIRDDPLVQAAMLGQAMMPPITPSPDGPGVPVLVDPIGVLAYPALAGAPPYQQWVAGVQNTIPRVCGLWGPFAPLVPGSNVPNLTVAGCLKWCTVQDDMVFVSDGPNQGLTADPPGPTGTVQRDLRYSYAWMLRMPRAGAPNVVDVSVLVFGGRSIDLVGYDTQEKAFQANFLPATNQIQIVPAGQDVSLRRGQWILDASVTTNPAASGFFYRIVSVSDPDPTSTPPGNVTVEVQTPLRGWSAPGTGTIVIFDNLLEVFDSETF